MSELEIASLQQGGLSPHEQNRFESHLRQCAACSARLRHAGTSPPPPAESTALFRSDPANAAPKPPLTIEGYDIYSEIHRGGQGIVYKALQRSTNRTVAIKVLPFEHTATERAKHRFEREVTLASNLHHSNIVTVYDSGLLQGRYYYVMEYVHGQPLDAYLRAASLSVHDKMRLFATICSAVSYAHQQGVTHRDLKPGNIIVDARGEPHVCDFGLAKTGGASAPVGKPISLTSEFMGTLAYAAPEQTRGDPTLVGTRTDVYSLGVILFEMLTGKYPYAVSGDLVKTFRVICEEQPRKPSDLVKGIDADTDTIVLRALAKEPERRYQTAAQLCTDVEHWLAGEMIEARRDSFSYAFKTRWISMVRKQRLLVMLAVAAAIALIAPYPFEWIFHHWQWPLVKHEQMVAGIFPAPGTPAPPFQDVRVIAIDDETPKHIAEIGTREEFTDVGFDVKQPLSWRSVRRLHGRLMEKLAAAGVKVVVWDIEFPDAEPPDPAKGESGYNANFVRGVKALQAVGVNPIIGVGPWTLDRDLRSGTDIIESGVAFGGASLGVPTDVDWRAQLAVQRGEAAIPFVSLSLAAFAAMRHGTVQPVPSLDFERQAIVLHFPKSAAAGYPCGSGSVLKLKLASIRQTKAPSESDIEVGIQPNDFVGESIIDLPPNAVLAGATLFYHDVMRADQTQLKRWFEDKLVIIADMRSVSPDWATAPDGRRVHCAYGHATAIDQMLRNVPAPSYLGWYGYRAVLMGGAFLGVACAFGAGGRVRTMALRGLLVLAGLACACVLAYGLSMVIIAPVLPALAALLAFIPALFIERAGRAPLATTGHSSAH